MQDWKHGLETAVRNAAAIGPFRDLLSNVLAAAHTGDTEVQPKPISEKAKKMPRPNEELSKPSKKRARADGTAALSDVPAGLQMKKKKRILSSKKQAETAAGLEEPTAQALPEPATKHAPDGVMASTFLLLLCISVILPTCVWAL